MESSYKKTVADQEKTIKKYEQKFRDLIEAYKALSKEKEALESTIKSLIGNGSNTSVSNNDIPDEKTASNQVLTLSNAIVTLTEEKRKMERNYLEDKRVTRGEYEVNLVALKTELDSQSIVIKELSGQLSELKAERSQSQEALQSQLQQLASQNDKRSRQLQQLTEELTNKDAIITRLDGDNDRLRQARNDLEQEMASMKNGHEGRVSLLEETISDLSTSIGEMEQQHLLDQDQIGRLCEKLRTAVADSRDLLAHKEAQSDTPDILQFQPEADKTFTHASIDSIVDKIAQLRAQLYQLDPSLDPISITVGGTLHSLGCNGDCESRIGQMREELENAQLAMQNYLKMNSSLFTASFHQQEIDRLNGELLMTRSKMLQLQDDLSNLDITSTRNVKTLKDSLTKADWTHKQEVTKLKKEYNQTILDLQSELTKHRNRTINLLSEKDTEIKSLQKQFQAPKLRSQSSRDQLNSDEEHEDHGDLYSSRNNTSCPLYQCCEIKARMEQELKKLRLKKRQLMAQIHKLESDIEYVKSDWKNEVTILSDRVQRAESINKLSTSVNMEYLRNVLFRFLSTSDPSAKYLMAKAIGRVLQFSSEELSSLKNTSWK